jgi:hypothetical protein
VLVAANGDLRRTLFRSLTEDEWLVLEADNSHQVLELFKVHSRPIHLLLMDTRVGGPSFTGELKPYSPYTEVVYLTHAGDREHPDALTPEGALAKAKELLRKLLIRAAAVA